MREGYWIVAATGEYHLVDDHAMWIQRPENSRALGLPEDVVEDILAVRRDYNGPGRRQILLLAMDNGLIRSRGHGPAEVTFEFRMDTEAAIRAAVQFMQATLGPASVPKFNNLRTGESLAFNYGNAKEVIEAGDLTFLWPVWRRPSQALPVRRPYVLLSDFDEMPGWRCWELPDDLDSEGLIAMLRRRAPQGCGWLALADGRTWKLKPNRPPLRPLEAINPSLATWACPSCGWPTRGASTPCLCANRTLCRVCQLPRMGEVVPGKDTITLAGETLHVPVVAGYAHKCIHWPSVAVLPFEDLIRRGR